MPDALRQRLAFHKFQHQEARALRFFPPVAGWRGDVFFDSPFHRTFEWRKAAAGGPSSKFPELIQGRRFRCERGFTPSCSQSESRFSEGRVT